jgi:hypothetical protein
MFKKILQHDKKDSKKDDTKKDSKKDDKKDTKKEEIPSNRHSTSQPSSRSSSVPSSPESLNSQQRSPPTITQEKPKEEKSKAKKDEILFGDLIMSLRTIDDEESMREWLQLFPVAQDRYTFYMWGTCSRVPAQFPAFVENKICKVECGGRHFLALTEYGHMYSWGTGTSGQLGHGNLLNVDNPTLIKAFRKIRIVRIDANGAQSAAISENGTLYVWGWRDTPKMISTPEPIEELRDVLRVSLGTFHIVALCSQYGKREVYSWG